MAVFKCKICGGTLSVNDNDSVAVCEYCGTTQTLPKLDDEKRIQLYDRANYFRRENEFDKAMGIYEMILSEDNEDYEAYWGIVLCRYGIQYVEDPRTSKRIPTVNRSQFTSIFEDGDYLNAIKYSDELQREIFKNEATAIDKIQKRILEISSKEEAFDVFICYKETDKLGNRTQDSVYAQDIYTALTKEGYKVFFARITLEDKLGSAYEPYIFAALNSAKVMLVVGTEKDNFNAVWVKNEWSRYLSLIKSGKNKTLIPVYKNITPYDMPEEFAFLQSQDMSKIGFMQDLIRGVDKLVGKNKTVVKETVVVNNTNGNINTEPLLKRAFMFLEDGDWNSANVYCEKVLDINPECAEAYLGKLMAILKIRKKEHLKNCQEPFNKYDEYKKTIRFANDELKNELIEYIAFINARNEKARIEGIYARARGIMSSAKTEQNYKDAAKLFYEISDYSDASALMDECKEKAEIARKDAILEDAKARMKKETNAISYDKAKSIVNTVTPAFEWAAQSVESMLSSDSTKTPAKALDKGAIINDLKENIGGETVSKYESIIAKLEPIADWKDASECIETCKTRIEEIKANDEKKRKEREENIELVRTNAKKYGKIAAKIAMIVVPIIIVIVIGVAVYKNIIVPNNSYKAALALMEKGEYSQAIAEFELLGGYKDSEQMIEDCKNGITESMYKKAVALMKEGKYNEAITEFEKLGGYKDVKEKIDFCKSKTNDENYNKAVALMNEGKNKEAISIFFKIKDHKDSAEKIKTILQEITVKGKVAAGYTHSVSINSDGTVKAIGKNYDGQCDVGNWTDIVAVSAGNNHTVGLKADGTVVATGDNEYGQCDVSAWTDIISISSVYNHTVGLKSDGTVVATGYNNDGRCDVDSWTDIIEISAGGGRTIGLKSNGTVVAVGNNGEGQCNVSEWTDIIAISAGVSCTVGLKSDGTVVAVGDNDDGQCNVSEWTEIVAISTHGSHVVGLKSDGTVIATGYNEFGQCDVSGWTDIVAISAGSEQTMGLKADGTVVTVGKDYSEYGGSIVTTTFPGYSTGEITWSN